MIPPSSIKTVEEIYRIFNETSYGSSERKKYVEAEAVAQYLETLLDGEQCQYDHHGYCQIHFGDEEADEKGVFRCREKKLLKTIKDLRGK